MNKTAANLLYFSVAVVLVKIIGALTTFVLARILSPAEYGTWVTLLIIGSYSSIACLGTIEALVKLYPFYAGSGQAEKTKRLESNVLGSIALAAGAFLLIGGTFPFFVHHGEVRALVKIIRCMVFAAGMGMFSAFFYHRFTAHQNFRYVSILDSLRALSLFILTIPFSWWLGLWGTALAFAANELIVLAFSYFVNAKKLGKVSVGFDLRSIGGLVAVGFPITIIWWVYMFQTSVDRLLSISMLGKVATGYYGLGTAIVSSIVLMPMVLGRVLYPKVNEEIGKKTDFAGLSRYVIMPAQGLGLALPILIGTMIIIIPDIYHAFFVKYSRGIASAQILLLGVYFVCLIRTGVNYLVAIDKQNKVLGFVAISLAANVCTSVLLVKFGLNIEGISIGTSVSGIVLATLLWKSVFRHLQYPLGKQYRELFALYLPFFISAVLCGGLLIFCRQTSQSPHPIGHVFAAVIFLILYVTAIFTIPPLNSWSKTLFVRMRALVPARRSR